MSLRYIPIIDYIQSCIYLYDVGIIGIIMVSDTTRANGVLTNFLVESSLLLRICIFYMGAPLSRVFAYQTNESTPLLRVPLLNTQ